MELISTNPKSYNILDKKIFNAPVENYKKHVEEF